uniref:Peptidase A1 domain-containing protein n=1 Tax=Ascaris lumbricoides TaxID=6252 RepID=A0A0M3IXE6_ASCLU
MPVRWCVSLCPAGFNFKVGDTGVVKFGSHNISTICGWSSSEVGDDVVQTTDGTVFDTKELDNDNVLARIPEWGFPIFYLAERHRLTTLSRELLVPSPGTYLQKCPRSTFLNAK